MSDRLAALLSRWRRAVDAGKRKETIEALLELESVDAEEPLWSHRLGEAYRTAGRTKEAAQAFARSMNRYARKGFVPRALAMAKLAAQLDPGLEGLAAQLGSMPTAHSSRAPAPVRPVLLERAKDALADEIRFSDTSGPPSIEIGIEDVEERDVAPPISEALPSAREPAPDQLGTMAAVRLFSGLSRDALVALSNAAELVEFVPTAMVIVRDERAFALYAIVDGSARVLVRGRPVIVLREGDVFGEACLLDEGKRQADVRAETNLVTLRIQKKALAAAVELYPEVGDTVFHLLARRLVANLMHTSPLFTMFEPKLRLSLAQMFEVRRAEPGTVLAERGRRSDGLYIVLAGDVVESREAEGETDVRVARGTAFGHGSLLSSAPSATTVRARTETVLLRLAAAKFSSFAALYPPALAELAETAEEPLPPSLLPD